MTLATTLIATPKADLHVHLEGTVDFATLRKLAKKNNVALAKPTYLEIKGGYGPIPPPNLVNRYPQTFSFEQFIAIYLKISESIKSAEDVMAIAHNYILSSQEQGIAYSEIYFTPTTFEALGADLVSLIGGLVAAQEAAKLANITFKWIFDIVRNADTSRGERTLELANYAKDIGLDVIAIGLAGYESHNSTRPFAEAFSRAQKLGFKTIVHAGETAGASAVKEALEILRPDRIAHAISIFEDKALVDELIETQIPIEVCPWSNISLGLADTASHPLARMLEMGLNVLIGSDDPGIFDKSLIENYLLAGSLGVSEQDLIALAANSLSILNKTPPSRNS
ncbi:MAG: adenosine deaminase [Deltaproteobacteria bacterium]|nr:adenosine deaminase [Deltaproteobacteria bacterium]